MDNGRTYSRNGKTILLVHIQKNLRCAALRGVGWGCKGHGSPEMQQHAWQFYMQFLVYNQLTLHRPLRSAML